MRILLLLLLLSPLLPFLLLLALPLLILPFLLLVLSLRLVLVVVLRLLPGSSTLCLLLVLRTCRNSKRTHERIIEWPATRIVNAIIIYVEKVRGQ